MVCSTKTAGAAARRGSVIRRVNRRRTLHSILAHTTYENDCFCGDGGGRGGNGPTSHLSGYNQLTHGGQNAEAYWSPDGKRLIFQTTRPPYDCDQIFVMNADGTDQHLVSTGKGRTTCGYFLADSKHIVYASTHLAGDACPTPPDRSKGYVWGVFAGYDIFEATDAGKIEKRLTDTPGYDAEATVNWKTGNIVYTSLASGDLDLWTMKADGSGKKQITKSPGYDGGAVFSRDGKMLVWRAGYPKDDAQMAKYKELLADNLTAPMKMELMVANADGSNQQDRSPISAARASPRHSLRTGRRFCSRRTSWNATAGSSNCT